LRQGCAMCVASAVDSICKPFSPVCWSVRYSSPFSAAIARLRQLYARS